MIGEVVIDIDERKITVRCPAASPHTHPESWRRALEVLDEHPHHEFESDRFLEDDGTLELVFVRLPDEDPLSALKVAH